MHVSVFDPDFETQKGSICLKTVLKSGTVEEIEKHISSGKPAMLYFSSQPVALDTVDLKQVEELKKFKSSCQSRGLYEGYDSHADFKEKFYRHLQLKINEHPMFKDINSENISPPVESSTQLPELSPEARVLLKEASLDPHGHILHVRYIGGTDIQTNGKNLIPSNERREVAKWEAALEELTYKDLLFYSEGQRYGYDSDHHCQHNNYYPKSFRSLNGSDHAF